MNRKEEIRNELEQIAPYLASLNLRPAFKVPKGYFGELPDSILESVSPLAELKKEQTFKVPQNYFESLPDLVLAKVAPEEEITVTAPVSSPSTNWLDDIINSVALLFQPRYALRLATVAILLVGGVLFLRNGVNTDPALASLDFVDPLEEEFGLSLDDLDDDDLAFLLTGEITNDHIDELEDSDLDQLLDELDELSDEDLEGVF